MRRALAPGRRLGHNVARAVRRLVARSVLDRPSRERPLWLLVRVGSLLSEQRPSGFSWSPGPPPIAWVDLLRALEAAADDPRVEGVVLRFEGSPGGLAHAATLRREVVRLRERGKRVWAWSESYDEQQYLVASAAERVELPPSGALHLVGLRTSQWFAREALDGLGVRADVVRIGANKAAAEPLQRRSMSPEQREQVEAIQDERYAALVEAIAEGRGLDRDDVRKAIDEGPHTPGSAIARGLVDGCAYPDQLERAIEEAARAADAPFRLASPPAAKTAGPVGAAALAPPAADEDEEPDVPLLDVAVYSALHASDVGWRPLGRDLPRLAYVVAQGTIARGRGTRGVTSQRYAELFAALRGDEAVRAVVVRIDSPGGDAVASDLLHRALERLAERKPVVVTMGEVAASGGYFLAAAAHRVLAERVSLTGSIGVVGGKLDLSGLYRRLGIDFEAVERGERSGLLSTTRGFDPDERRALQDQMRSIYEAFKDRVARGRGLEPAAVEAAAQGRVFCGARALELGLVDALGGPLEAIAEACERAGLDRGERYVLDVHPAPLAFGGLGRWLARPGGRARLRLH